MHITAIADLVRECRGCPLYRRCNGPVPGVGTPAARLMVVGQAPGIEEDAEGIPWIGQAGQFLSAILENLGWTAPKVYFTNLAKCFPGRKYGGDNEPSQEALTACTVHLKREIDSIRPDLILAVGALSAKYFGIKGGINKNSGKVFDTPYGKVMVIMHPAGLMRKEKSSDTPLFTTLLNSINTFFEGSLTPPAHSKPETWLEERGYV